MYYKIENKDCEVYKKLYELRASELRIETANKKAIAAKIGLEWVAMYGYEGQQNFLRTSIYLGFEFLYPEKADLKIWKRDKENPEILIPNTATKAGREMKKFLQNGLQRSDYSKVFEILNLEHHGRFTFPFVEIAFDMILVYLGDKHIPKDINLIEITSKEFDKIGQSI